MKGASSANCFLIAVLLPGVVCYAEYPVEAKRPSLVRLRNNYARSFTFRNFTNPYVDFIDRIFLHLQESINITDQCQEDTKLLFELAGDDNKFALKILDATGKLSSGVLEGGIAFPGFFSECLSVTSAANDSTHDGFPFSAQYCSVGGQISSKSAHEDVPEAVWDILTESQKIFIGLCVPSSCSVEDVTSSANSVVANTFNGSSPNTVVSCHVRNENKLLADTPALIFLCFLGVYVAIAISATVYDIYCPLTETPSGSSNPVSLHEVKSPGSTDVISTQPDGALPSDDHSPEMNQQEFPSPSSLECCSKAETRSIFTVPAAADLGSQQMLCEKNQPASKGWIVFKKCFRAFSLRKSAQSILTVRKASSQIITSFDGIRLFSMLLIIIGHTYSFGMLNLFIRNPLAANDAPKDGIIFHAFSNGTLTVDSFYFLSGTLTAFLTLKILARSNGKLNIFQFYLHRFIRLTPLLMVIIAICALVLRHLGDGPNWMGAITMYDVWCEKNWWINLLYLQNFINTENMCLSHSWYLATDMQFALVTPFILLALHRKLLYGAIMLLCLFIGTVTATFVITWVNDYPAIPYFNNVVALDKMNAYYKNVYIKPYCRIGPYLIGIALGYFLFKHKELKLSKAYVVICWCVSAILALIVIFGMWPATSGDLPSTTSAAFYSSLARSAWAVFLAWMVLSCFYGYGGFVNSILSWPPLEPFSKLTYSAYLIHPVVMNVYYGMVETTVQFSNSFMAYTVLGNVVLTYLISFVLSILFEVPLVSLEKVLTAKKH